MMWGTWNGATTENRVWNVRWVLAMVAFVNLALDTSREDHSSASSMEKEKGKLRALQMLCWFLSFEQEIRVGNLLGEKILFSQ